MSRERSHGDFLIFYIRVVIPKMKRWWFRIANRRTIKTIYFVEHCATMPNIQWPLCLFQPLFHLSQIEGSITPSPKRTPGRIFTAE